MYFTNHIFFCNNRREAGHSRGCCAEKNSDELREYMKSRLKELAVPKTRVNQAGCLDRCEKGPCMVIYPQGIWYSPKSKEDVDVIIKEHLQEGKIVEELVMP